MNPSISARNRGHAGSSSSRRWLALSRMTNRLSGSSAASRRAALDRQADVSPAVDHQARRGHAADEVRDVDAAERLDEPRGVGGGGRAALQLVEGLPLLLRARGHELHGEHPAERGVVPAPAEAHQLHLHASLFVLVNRRGPDPASLHEGAEEDQAPDPFGMSWPRRRWRPVHLGRCPGGRIGRGPRRRPRSPDRPPRLGARSPRRPSRRVRNPVRRNGPAGSGRTAPATSAARPGSPSRSRDG